MPLSGSGDIPSVKELPDCIGDERGPVSAGYGLVEVLTKDIIDGDGESHCHARNIIANIDRNAVRANTLNAVAPPVQRAQDRLDAHDARGRHDRDCRSRFFPVIAYGFPGEVPGIALVAGRR